MASRSMPPATSTASRSSAGTGRPRRNPWALMPPRATSARRSSGVSMSSATTSTSRACPNPMMAVTMAWSMGSSARPVMEDWSTLTMSTGRSFSWTMELCPVPKSSMAMAIPMLMQRDEAGTPARRRQRVTCLTQSVLASRCSGERRVRSLPVGKGTRPTPAICTTER